TPWPRCRSRGVPLLSTTRFALTIRIDDDPWFRSANRCPERSPQWCKVCFPRSREQRLAIRATQNMTPSGTTHYVYDRQGHLLVEASGTGNTVREYVWFDDMPLAVVA